MLVLELWNLFLLSPTICTPYLYGARVVCHIFSVNIVYCRLKWLHIWIPLSNSPDSYSSSPEPHQSAWLRDSEQKRPLSFPRAADAMFTPSCVCHVNQANKRAAFGTCPFGTFKEACSEGCITLSCPNHLACSCVGKRVHNFPLPTQLPEGCMWLLWLQGAQNILRYPRYLGKCQIDLTKFKKYRSSSRSGSLTDWPGRCLI